MRSSSVAVSADLQADTEAELHRTPGSVVPLGQGYLVLRSRLRLTLDGGHSLLAVSTPGMNTRLGRVSGRADAEHTGTSISWSGSSAAFGTAANNTSPTNGFGTNVSSSLSSSNTFTKQSATIAHNLSTSHAITTSGPSSSDRNGYVSGTRGAWGEVADTIEDVRGEAKHAPQDMDARVAAHTSNTSSAAPLSSTMLSDSEQSTTTVEMEKNDLITSSSSPAGDLPVEKLYPAAIVPSTQGTSDSELSRVVIHLTGDKERFIPLIEYVQAKFDLPAVPYKFIQRRFCVKQPTIYGTNPTQMKEIIEAAVSLHLLVKSGGTNVMLNKDATYIFPAPNAESPLESIQDTSTVVHPPQETPRSQPGAESARATDTSQDSDVPDVPHAGAAENGASSMAAALCNGSARTFLPTTLPHSTPSPNDIHLIGLRSRFAPLVAFLQHRLRSTGTHINSVNRITNHFCVEQPDYYGQDPAIIHDTVRDAFEQGVIGKWSVDESYMTLVKDANYVFEKSFLPSSVGKAIPTTTAQDQQKLRTASQQTR